MSPRGESHNDWQTFCSKLKHRGQHMLETGLWSDCVFLIGADETKVGAHKLLLAMGSPVFEAMFYGPMAETDTVSIPDITLDVFNAMLFYIYTDKAKINSLTSCIELYYAAHKYMLPHLSEQCTAYLSSNITPQNVCRAYELAHLFDDHILIRDTLEVIRNNPKEVLNDTSFEDLQLDTVIRLFTLDPLNIDSELELFHAAERYMAAQEAKPSKVCGIQSVQDTNLKSETKEAVSRSTSTETSHPDVTIRKALQRIRFLTLTAEKFSEGPARSALLTKEEREAIHMNILVGNSDTTMPIGFTTCKEARNKQLQKTTTDEESKPVKDKVKEITYRFTIRNFRNRTNPVLSPPFRVQDLPWRIKAMPKFRDGDETVFFGFYLQCDGVQNSDSWSCFARAQLRLLSHDPDTPSIEKDIEHVFYSNQDDWGYSEYSTWEAVQDPAFLRHDALTLEVHVVADQPEGIE